MKKTILFGLLILLVTRPNGVKTDAPVDSKLLKTITLNQEIVSLKKRISHFDEHITPLIQNLKKQGDLSLYNKSYRYWLELLYSAFEYHNKTLSSRKEYEACIKLITNKKNNLYRNWLALLNLQSEEQIKESAEDTFSRISIGKYKHNPIELKTKIKLINPTKTNKKLLENIKGELRK